MDYEKALACEEALAELRFHRFGAEWIEILDEAITPIIENEKRKKHKAERKVCVMYDDYKPTTEIQKAITAIMTGSKFHLIAHEEVGRRNLEVSDLVHAVEHAEDEDKLNELVKDMQEVAQDRRVAKNFAELSKPIHDFKTKHPKAVEDLKKLHGELNRIEQSILTRRYYPREKTAMEVAFESILEKQQKEEETL